MTKKIFSKAEKFLIELYKRTNRDKQNRPFQQEELGYEMGVTGKDLVELIGELTNAKFILEETKGVCLTERGKNLAERLLMQSLDNK